MRDSLDLVGLWQLRRIVLIALIVVGRGSLKVGGTIPGLGPGTEQEPRQPAEHQLCRHSYSLLPTVLVTHLAAASLCLDIPVVSGCTLEL